MQLSIAMNQSPKTKVLETTIPKILVKRNSIFHALWEVVQFLKKHKEKSRDKWQKDFDTEKSQRFDLMKFEDGCNIVSLKYRSERRR